MTPTLYYLLCAVLSVAVLLGISMMSRVKTAVRGNLLSAVSLFAGIAVTLIYNGIASVWNIYLYMVVGVVIGSALAIRVKMIEMPQMVALLNGVGGLASALVGILTLLGVGHSTVDYPLFTNVTAILAVEVGVITLVGSLVAAGKLHKLLPQRPVIWRSHAAVLNFCLILLTLAVLHAAFAGEFLGLSADISLILLIGVAVSALFGYAFSIRVGGADMPITISLLNSLSGVAGAIAGMAISDILLVSVGGIVGASGLFLTQIMCRSMNRSLIDILTGKTSVSGKPATVSQPVVEKSQPVAKGVEAGRTSSGEILRSARSVIIVPGYGMALAQAQHLVRQLADKLESNGARVRYAIHPVAGRMPGHMNVLLAEADVPYEQLYEMDAINGDFKDSDAVIVIGANDVLNPAARDAVGTPIYGMPVLNVDEAKEIFICNFDLSPGYAGVENPLYTRKSGVHLMLGDAKESLTRLLDELEKTDSPVASPLDQPDAASSEILRSARSVIIVPGYGMALAQAQHLVRQLADKLESNGARVRYAIHPVAGRMPGHMNVLLAEADVPYEQLYEMDAINGDFKDSDAVIVIGANDVLNPAARDAVGTPIYGMPVLNVDEAKEIFICNFDLSPGYAGVENPLYTRKSGVHLMLGDAKESLSEMLGWLK
jgi:NAD(P) transhydrogenase subunit beta